MVASRKTLIVGKSQVVSHMRLTAAKYFFTGRDIELDREVLTLCSYFHKESGTRLVFTRDVGYHSSGWWKNPDYERCYHLSLSFSGIDGNQVFELPKSRLLTKDWIDLFFGTNKEYLWTEPPYSQDGKRADVWHYRLFCDESWTPFKPQGEVYDRSWTPAGWKSYSDLKHDLER